MRWISLSLHVLLLFPASLCRQSAVVPAPYGRWVEKFSWETKGTEEERQVGRNGRRRRSIRSVVLGLGAKLAISSERKDKRGHRHLGWMESARTSASRWSWWLCVAHLRCVWSEETEVCFCCSLHSRLFDEGSEAALSGGCEEVGLRFFGYFKGWQC